MEMRKMEELKMKLMRDLEHISAKNPLTASDVAMIDTLTHAIKNLCKIMEEEEQGESHYSGRHYVRGHYSRDGGSYANSRDGSYGNSYGGGSYTSGYSENSYRDMKDMLEREYSNARDERERDTIRSMMDKM